MVKSIKKQHGGNMVGRGTYGCVYRPMIQCQNHSEMPDCERCVTKVSDENEITSEYEMSQKFDRMDPEGYYHTLSYHPCRIDTRPECQSRKGLENNFALHYKDGGMNLLDYFSDLPDDFSSERFIKNFGNVLEGVKLLHDYNFGHFDIKPGNIVIDDQGVMRLIDYGMMISMDDPRQFLKERKYASPYTLWPPELFVVASSAKSTWDIVLYMRKVVEEYRVHGLGQLIESDTIIRMVKRLENLQRRHDEVWYDIIDKVDVFSLGYTLAMIHAILVDQKRMKRSDWLDDLTSRMLSLDYMTRPSIVMIVDEWHRDKSS